MVDKHVVDSAESWPMVEGVCMHSSSRREIGRWKCRFYVTPDFTDVHGFARKVTEESSASETASCVGRMRRVGRFSLVLRACIRAFGAAS